MAEAHDLAHALALGVEIRPTLAAAHRQPGQRVLERLFEREEFEHAFGDARVETDAALIGSDRIVVLDAPAALDADIAVVVLPADAEGHDPVGFGDAPQYLLRVIFFLVGDEVENVLRHFLHRLHELGLPRIAPLHAFHERRKIDVIRNCHAPLPC